MVRTTLIFKLDFTEDVILLGTVLFKNNDFFSIKYLPAEVLSALIPQMIEIICLESLAFFFFF